MTVRTFGAIKGAGTQVRERIPAKPIAEAPLGSTVIVGAFRSGPVGEVTSLPAGLPQYRRVFGGLTQDSEAPLACEHFYAMAAGAGVLHLVRVTDGSEVKANLDLYSRDVDRGILERVDAVKVPTVVATIDAHNGGRWGGRRYLETGDVDLSTKLTTNTVDIGGTHLADRWEGATITFPNDDAAAVFNVTGNTTAGVLTISGEWTDDVINGTDGRYVLELSNTHELTSDPEYLGIEVADSGEDPATKFSLTAYRDGAAVKTWSDLGLDSGGDSYWLDALDGDADNFEVDPTDAFSGDPADPYQRPANFAEIPAPGGVSATSVTFQIVRWALGASNTGDPYLDTVNDMTWGSDPRPVTITITFSNATTFTVSATYEDGGTADDLPGGTVGAAYVSQNDHLPGFTIRAGAVAAVLNDTITIYVRPLPANLQDRGAWFYPAAAPAEGDVRERYRVVSNDHDTVNFAANVDVTSSVDAPGAPVVSASTAEPFNMSAGSLTLIYSVGGTGPYTLTSTLSGASETAAAVAADYDAQELARAGSAAAKLVSITANASNQIVITALQDYGQIAVLTIGNGTVNGVIGLTNGQNSSGADPSICRLQWVHELGGGYDGLSGLSDSDYEVIWDLATSPLNDLIEVDTGLLRLAMPGVTAVDPQTAMMGWAYTNNALAYVEIADTITTESGAIAQHEGNFAIGPAQDYHVCHWPSYGSIASPYGTGLYTASIYGAILGVEARKAAEAGGYHLAPAGTDYVISPLFKDLPTEDRRLDQELLNDYGLIETRKRGPRIYPWGDRIPGNNGRSWKHVRASMSHIGRTLLTNTTSLVWSPINPKTFAQVKGLLIGLFRPWWRRGWFSGGGDDGNDFSFEASVEIKVDASNNPASEQALGNLHADASFGIVATAERVIFSIGPKGVQEQS